MSRSRQPYGTRQPTAIEIVLIAVAVLVGFFILIAPLLAAADPLIK